MIWKRTLGLFLFIFASFSFYVAVSDIVADFRNDPLSAESHLSGNRPDSWVAVYILTGRAKCPTCDDIIALTDETLTEFFAKETKRGEIAVIAANVEEKGNEWYIDKFEIFSTSVVLARYEKGEIVSWDNLEEVWDLASKAETFKPFMKRNIEDMLRRES